MSDKNLGPNDTLIVVDIAYARQQRDRLPVRLLSLAPAEAPYEVAVSDGLRKALREVEERVEKEEAGG